MSNHTTESPVSSSSSLIPQSTTTTSTSTTTPLNDATPTPNTSPTYLSDTARAQQDSIPPKSLPILASDAIKMITWKDFTNVHQIPCVREALLTGIGTGFAFGGVKAILRSTVSSATTWAVMMFSVSSIAVFESCRWKRGREKDNMIKAMHAMVESKRKKEEAMKEKREKLRVRRAEAERLRIEAEKRWWKPWTWSDGGSGNGSLDGTTRSGVDQAKAEKAP